jgi:hypothetical protein
VSRKYANIGLRFLLCGTSSWDARSLNFVPEELGFKSSFRLEIWGSQRGEGCPLWYDDVCSLLDVNDVSEERSGSIFVVEERGDMFLRNVCEQIAEDTNLSAEWETIN